MAAKPSLTIKKRIKAAPEKVYAAWTEPEKLMQWFGPDDGKVVSATTDVRVGGRYHVAFHTLDGERHDVGGVYDEVVPNEKLSFSWAWRTMPERESHLTLIFKRDGEGTLLTLLHEQFFDEPARDRHYEGWSGALDKLDRLLSQ